MSGSSSIVGSGENNFGYSETECTRISVKTILNSPVSEVLSNLSEKDILNVIVKNESSLVAVTKGGDVAGALTPPILPRIVECIEEGYQYVAIVISVSGGECRVHVKLRSEG